MIQSAVSTVIQPSSASLLAMIDRAMVKCDVDCEQARLRAEAREDERIARQWAAEVEANRRRRLYGR